MAMRLRILIARRAEHPDWLVSPQLDGWLTGAIGLRKGVSQEVDEFSRAAKRALIRAAWADVRALEQRMQHGSELLATGRDFRVGGWLVPTNLLWAIENEIVTTRGINAHLPPVDEWPAALLDLLPPDAPRNNWRRTLLRVLARMLYPSTLDCTASESC
jgi:hypothetical protein